MFFFFFNSNRKLLEKEVEALDDLDGCLLLLQRAWRILRKNLCMSFIFHCNHDTSVKMLSQRCIKRYNIRH